MHLTVHTDYALRVLMYAAVHDTDTVTISRIAEAYDISRNHLMKVVHRLGTAGFLTTTRGRGGGISLARQSEQIIVGDVVRAMEDDFGLVECMNASGGVCVISEMCRLRQALKRALDAFLAVLDEYTLADLTRQPQLLRRVLT